MTSGPLDPIDNRLAILTPEFMWFHHQLAGPFSRLEAYAIDLILRVLGLVAVILIVQGLFSVGLADVSAVGMLLVLYFIVDWGYGALFEATWNGQTPGKRWLDLRVLSTDGRPVNVEQAVIRNLLRAADILPFLFITGAASMLSTRRFQRLGDLAAGTIVVRERTSAMPRPPKRSEPQVAELAARLPPSFLPSRDLRETLAEYVVRRHRFRPRRRNELAAILATPLRRTLDLPAEARRAADEDPDRFLCALHHKTLLPGGSADGRSGAP